jgi:sec-independent protein translocase protein TatC
MRMLPAGSTLIYTQRVFGTFSSTDLQFLPRVEDVFGLVTARFLWRHIKYAILLIFIVAAVLTPSTDPWNQTVFAAPMIVLYLLSIAIAWAVAPRGAR